MGRFWIAALAVVMMSHHAATAETVLLHAAGSLRGALTDVSAAFESQTGNKVQAKYGASGLLKDEIAGGAKAGVFASANMDHPQALAKAGKSGPVVLFARNKLCALVRPGLTVTPATLLERMLDPAIKLGASTPRADPSGDYAFEVFSKAEAFKPGAKAMLEGKALQLTGGPTSAAAPAGRSVYGWNVAEGRADIFLAYCTATVTALRENPSQQQISLPDDLAVGADYGLTVLNDAPPAAYALAMFILSGGQRILANHGFAVPGLAK
jgi:ABC-type molybdate transport system substrate-binding protein